MKTLNTASCLLLKFSPHNGTIISDGSQLEVLRIEFRENGRLEGLAKQRIVLEAAAFAVFNVLVLYADTAAKLVGDAVAAV